VTDRPVPIAAARRGLRLLAAAAGAILLAAPASAGWVATWAAAPQHPPARLAAHFEDQTLRLVVRTSAGGAHVRIRLSNLYGAAPLFIGAARIGLRTAGADIAPATDRPLLFHGRASVRIPPGATALSDAADLEVPRASDLAISLYLPQPTTADTMHVLALQTSYVSAQHGDLSAAASFPVEKTLHNWPFLTAVDTLGPQARGAVAAFGDSTVDGDGSTADRNQRWPDLLAHRLGAAGTRLAVVNAGLIANRLLRGTSAEMRPQFGDIAGEAAIRRLDRDALDQAGVRCVIVRIGTNDIGFPGAFTPAAERVGAADLITGYARLVARAHRRGVAVIGTTIPPFEGAALAPGFYTEAKEAVRVEVNNRLRAGHVFDGLIDMDAVLREPAHPARLLPGYDSGDHLHPNDEGYRALADAIPLPLLSARCGRNVRMPAKEKVR
jgi:lysophospholipase L1-like esterase